MIWMQKRIIMIRPVHCSKLYIDVNDWKRNYVHFGSIVIFDDIISAANKLKPVLKE